MGVRGERPGATGLAKARYPALHLPLAPWASSAPEDGDGLLLTSGPMSATDGVGVPVPYNMGPKKAVPT